MDITTTPVTRLTASEGKTLAIKETGEILGPTLWLGCKDSPDNYTEVDAPLPADYQLEV